MNLLSLSTIVHDKTSAISFLQGRGIIHQHQHQESGAHTQTIESHWNVFKRRNKCQSGTHRHMVEGYMCEFLWRLKFREDCLFDRIMLDIAEFYPTQ